MWEWLNGLWSWFGSDFGGNIAQWVGGLGTIGALLLGFILLARELNTQRRADAENVITSFSIADKPLPDEDLLAVEIDNRTALMVPSVSVYGLDQTGGGAHKQTSMIAGNSKRRVSFSLSDFNGNSLMFVCRFTDGRGRLWTKEVITNRIVRNSKYKSAMEKIDKEASEGLVSALRKSVEKARQTREAAEKSEDPHHGGDQAGSS